MATFGETGTGSATTAADFADKAAVTTAILAEPALVSKLTMRLSNQGASHAACQGYAVIYTDNAAVPHARCATGSAVDVADDAALGDVDFAFATAVFLMPGTYHIGVIFDADAAGVALRYAAGGREDTHADTPPPLELWGSTSTTANTYCCYGTYTAITQTRPLVADTHILVTTAARAPVGEVPARVRWTEVLDGPDRLDSVTMPKWFLKQNGVRVSRPELATYGWYVKSAGHWYTLDRVLSDNETTVTFAGKSLEVSDLKRTWASTSVNTFVRTAEVPTDIVTDLLGGSGEIALANGHMEDLAYNPSGSGTYWRVDQWAEMRWIGTPEPPDIFPDEENHSSEMGTTYPTTYGAYTLAQVDDTAGGGRAHVVGDYYIRNDLGTYTYWVCWLRPYHATVISPVSSGRYTDYGNSAGPYTLFGAGDGSTITFSADLRCLDEAELAEYATLTGTIQLWIMWVAPDLSTIIGVDVEDVTASVTDAYQTFTVTAARKSGYFMPMIRFHRKKQTVEGSGITKVYVDNCVLSGVDMAEPSDWSYYGALDVRSTDILHTDGDWIEFGTWTVGASDISATVVGNRLVYIFTGDVCTIHFTVGGAGALCNVYVDDALHTADVDVSAATTLAITGLDPEVEHLVKIEVVAVKTAVEKLVVSPLNRMSVHWGDMDSLACLDDLVGKTGGELYIDTENKRIYHAEAWGSDLLAENIIDLRRGSNLLSLDVEKRRDQVVNNLLYLGYGSGATRLRLTVKGQGVNDDGESSEEVHGVQWGKLENPDCQDFYTGQLEAQAAVNEWQWTAVEYRATCLDEAAAYVHAGDTVRIYWDADPDDIINVSVRVLEITRDNEGGPATLIVGTRGSQLPDRLASTARKLDGISRNL